MTNYPIIANCNYECSTGRGLRIHEARLAVDAGEVNASLVDALDDLEVILAEHSDSGDVDSVNICTKAEIAVVRAWNELLDSCRND